MVENTKIKNRTNDKLEKDNRMKMHRCMLAMLLALAFVVPSCEPSKPVVEADYAAKIVGDWVGTVGDMKESITFRADGGFVAQLRPLGFISNTLSQSVAGTIRGTWDISGKTITLKITASDALSE